MEDISNMSKSVWETIERVVAPGATATEETKRLKVHNGWLVMNRFVDRTTDTHLQCLHYFKDEEFKWKV